MKPRLSSVLSASRFCYRSRRRSLETPLSQPAALGLVDGREARQNCLDKLFPWRAQSVEQESDLCRRLAGMDLIVVLTELSSAAFLAPSLFVDHFCQLDLHADTHGPGRYCCSLLDFSSVRSASIGIRNLMISEVYYQQQEATRLHSVHWVGSGRPQPHTYFCFFKIPTHHLLS